MTEQLLIANEDRARIRRAVIAAEATTSGEIFTVVARVSDDYRFIPLLWATLAALAVPMPLVLLTMVPALHIFLAQLAVFVVLAVVLSLPPLHRIVVPAPTQRARAHALAVEQFLAHGLHMTEARTGVLIFVSIAERYAEIVADAAIADKVGQEVWDAAIEKLVAEIKAGRLAEGLIAAIGDAGAVLAVHFPKRNGDRDELANDLVIL